MTAVTRDGAAAGAYKYDDNGNRTAARGAAATYDAQDRLIAHRSRVAAVINTDRPRLGNARPATSHRLKWPFLPLLLAMHGLVLSAVIAPHIAQSWMTIFHR